MPWLRKRIPRDVEPAVASQELVGIGAGAKEGDETLELLGVARADVSGLAKEVLRILDATDKGVDTGVAVAGVDEDRTNHLSSGFQEHQAAIGHVGDGLHRGDVVGILAQLAELCQREMIR
jgi:hypothetical protein